MKELKGRFPDGLDYQIVYDTTPFIHESVNEVFYTLRDAIILVALVVLVFLQNWRAALIPLIAVPVAIVGTFAFMAALGFSLNNLSLFGLVLAIGIVVDDAIVVVENIERWLEQGIAPRGGPQGHGRSDRAGHRRGPGALCRVRAVRLSGRDHRPVLPPIRRDDRRFHRDLRLQLADAQPGPGRHPAPAARRAKRDPLTWLLDLLLGWFFRLFNVLFGASTTLYTRVVGGLLRVSLIALLIYGGLLGLTYWQFNRAPTGFIPAAGQRLPASQRAVARFRLGGTHARKSWRRSKTLAHDIAGRRPYRRHFRPVADPERQCAEPGLDVRHAQGFSDAAVPA